MMDIYHVTDAVTDTREGHAIRGTDGRADVTKAGKTTLGKILVTILSWLLEAIPSVLPNSRKLVEG